jgi:endonuclease/exonuclease/phosphatase family protein
MKIASFNINNINRRLPNLLAWLRETAPDVVCLQELKATDAEFPVKAVALRMAKIAVTFEGTKHRLHQAYAAAKPAARLSCALFDRWMADALTLSKGQPVDRATVMLHRTAVMLEIAAERKGWPDRTPACRTYNGRPVLPLRPCSVRPLPDGRRRRNNAKARHGGLYSLHGLIRSRSSLSVGEAVNPGRSIAARVI